MPEIKSAMACYTGGGIYVYWGELTDGTYFRTCDDWECIEVVDAPADGTEAEFVEFYKNHSVHSLEGEEYKAFWNAMLQKIVKESPQGNYLPEDLEARMVKRSEPAVIGKDRCFEILTKLVKAMEITNRNEKKTLSTLFFAGLKEDELIQMFGFNEDAVRGMETSDEKTISEVFTRFFEKVNFPVTLVTATLLCNRWYEIAYLDHTNQEATGEPDVEKLFIRAADGDIQIQNEYYEDLFAAMKLSQEDIDYICYGEREDLERD